MLWMINTTLHLFGWSIVIEYNGHGEVIRAYPARVKYRGFSEKTNTWGYKKISEYMVENSVKLAEEAND